MKPYLLTEVDREGIEDLVNSPDWVFEQKVDGTRAIAHYLDGEVTWYSRAGAVLKHTAATQHLTDIGEALHSWAWASRIKEVIIDGEILIGEGIYWIFDTQMLKGSEVEVTAEDTWRQRQRVLRLFLGKREGRIRMLPSFSSMNAKARLIEKVEEEGAEGVVAKQVHAPYLEGRSKDALKFKFVKTADVVVTKVDRPSPKHGSISFGVFEDGELIDFGTCSAIGKPDVQPGDVIEVAYLYRADTGGLVQPRMTRERFDKTAEECTIDQFPKYSREIVRMT